ncbi:hypothetical protein ELQ92_11915 [Labedella populi]|uniref:Uncharacterized protein n=1 Tax=Labedella populi TaxID=2498850 RepID=A0A444Q6K3_9MICO|nr:hypothetical protein [Labedella populi]RWZ59532.1 hypothetical protein ELQ92_11915 [Labedella populi]
MKRITYGTETFIVSDRAGEELLKHARDIAASHEPEVVRIPVIQQDGSTRQAAMLIGPNTPVLAIDAPDLEPAVARVSTMARVRSIDPAVVYDDSSTYFDIGFDA